MSNLDLEYLQLEARALRMCCIQLEEKRKRSKIYRKCIQKLMETLVLVNNVIENIIGLLTRSNIDLVMVKINYSMELLCHYMLKDLIKHSLKQLLSRRLLKIRKQLHQIN